MIKRQTLIILTLLFVMSLFVTVASANDVENATICIGEGSGYVTIPIVVTNSTNVGSVDVTLRYDPSIVIVVDAVDGDMDSTFQNLENAADGWIRIVSYQGISDGIDGTFVLANVSFEPVGTTGSCPLEISVTSFGYATPTGNAMPYVVDNGTYTISYVTPNSRSNREGTYPPVPDDDDDSGKNITEENASVNTTIIETPTPSPVKNLPGDDTEDDAPDGTDPTSAIFIVLGIMALIVIGYVIYRKSQQ